MNYVGSKNYLPSTSVNYVAQANHKNKENRSTAENHDTYVQLKQQDSRSSLEPTQQVSCQFIDQNQFTQTIMNAYLTARIGDPDKQDRENNELNNRLDATQFTKLRNWALAQEEQSIQLTQQHVELIAQLAHETFHPLPPQNGREEYNQISQLPQLNSRTEGNNYLAEQLAQRCSVFEEGVSSILERHDCSIAENNDQGESQ